MPHVFTGIVETELIEPQVVGVEHSVMFHGDGRRPGSLLARYTLGDDLEHPMHIRRSGTFVPPLFSPTPGRLAVTDTVRDSIARVTENVQFLRIEVDKVVDLAVAKGDFSMREAALADRYGPNLDTLLDRLPDIPGLHEQIGPFYEVIVPRASDRVNEFSHANIVDIGLYMGPRDDDCLTTHICTDMLEVYPIVSAPKLCWVVRDDVFEILDPFIDRDYYIVKSFDL